MISNKPYIKKNTCQLVPLHFHRRNVAEGSIKTFKNHFLAGLASCNPQCPLRKWNRLLTQAAITLSLLQNTRVNKKLSAYTFLFDQFDFNKYPLKPPGTHVVVHPIPCNRAFFCFHGKYCWTIGPMLDHYRCIQTYISQTGAEINCDTFTFFSHSIPIPKFWKKINFSKQLMTSSMFLQIRLNTFHTFKLVMKRKMHY